MWLLTACTPSSEVPTDTTPSDDTDETADTTPPDDTAPPKDTAPPDDTAAPPPVIFACDDDFASPTARLPPILKNDDGRPYRVVQIPSDDLDPLYAVVFIPQVAPAYDAGAPVVVAAFNSVHLSTRYATSPSPSLSGEVGIVEVHPLFPGWTVGDFTTEGIPDNAGPQAALALADTVRFVTGRTDSIDGLSLPEIIEQPACNHTAILLGTSAGGIAAGGGAAALGAELADLVSGMTFYETATLPQFLTLDGGGISMDFDLNVDTNGSGFDWDDASNPAYTPGKCSVDGCGFDYNTATWDPDTSVGEMWPGAARRTPAGTLYLDLNGNGKLDVGADGTPDLNGNDVLDLDDDYVLPGYRDTDTAEENLLYFSPQAVAAAQAAGVLSPWPENLMSAEAHDAFWADRNMLALLLQAAPNAAAHTRVHITYSAMDHATALPSRPQLVVLYESLREAGITVQLGADEDAVRCLASDAMSTDWTPAPAENTPVAEGELAAWGFPDAMPRPIARSIGAIGAMWSLFGPFDSCAE